MNVNEFISLMEAVPERLAASIDDAMRDMAEPVYADIRDNFLGAHDPDGSSWPPRKDTGFSHPLLMDTGALSEAAGTPNAPGSICTVADGELTIGVNKDGGEGGIPGEEYGPLAFFIFGRR